MQCRHVLIIEDNPGDATLVQAALKEADMIFEVTHFKDGEQAHGFLTRIGDAGAASPDLVLLDLNLPKRNGWRLFAEIRSHPVLKQVPIVIFSSSEDPRDRARVESDHRSIFIQKPATIEEFMSVGREIRRFASSYWSGA